MAPNPARSQHTLTRREVPEDLLSPLAHQRFGRRALLGSLGLAAVGAAAGGPAVASPLAPAAPPKPPVPPQGPGTLCPPDPRPPGPEEFQDVPDHRAHPAARAPHTYPA